MTPIAHEILAQLTVTKIVVDSMAAYALTSPPINRQKSRCYPWVLQRDRLVASYMGLLKALREAVKDQRKPTAFDPSLDGHLDGGDGVSKLPTPCSKEDL